MDIFLLSFSRDTGCHKSRRIRESFSLQIYSASPGNSEKPRAGGEVAGELENIHFAPNLSFPAV